MEHKVIPFVATTSQQNINVNNIAQQLEELIKVQTNQGWKYVRLESVSTYVQPVTGCFGNTVHHGFMTTYQMALFTKEDNEIPANSSH